MKTLFLIPCVFFLSDCEIINLAWKKRVYISSVHGEHFARYAVDGIIDEDNYAEAYNMNGEGWIVVDLGRPSLIDWVDLMHLYLCKSCGFDIGYDFILGLSNTFDPMLNETGIPEVELIKDISLNYGGIASFMMDNDTPYYRYVSIHYVGKPRRFLTVYEIEVIGEYINYVGCFNSMLNNSTISLNSSLQECVDNCNKLESNFSALQKTKCICGGKARHSSPLSECNVLCPRGVDYCGSADKLSVYEANPSKVLKTTRNKYIGCCDSLLKFDDLTCFHGYKMVDYSLPSASMTTEMCQNHCAETLVTLYFAIKDGFSCCCLQMMDIQLIIVANEISCGKSCLGNFSQKCGGHAAFSVYQTILDKESVNYFPNNNHCKDGADLDLDGICGNQQCEDGWTGEDCAMRDCSVNNGDCGAHECQTMKGKAGVFSECICKEGFDKSFWWDYCLGFAEELNLSDGSSKAGLDQTTTIVIVASIILLVLIVGAFTFTYFIMTRKIRTIQTGVTSQNTIEGTVKPGLDRYSSLYDEINPDEEMSVFKSEEGYASLDESTKDKAVGSHPKAGSNTYSILKPLPAARPAISIPDTRESYLELVLENDLSPSK